MTLLKRIFRFLLSSGMTAVLLVILGIAMGTATFIEEAYDTATARSAVYNAVWFEIILFLLAVNFLGNIGKYNLLRKEKFSQLLFHLAFILMILGAGITRYFGFEGLMHIREGESSDVIVISSPSKFPTRINAGSMETIRLPFSLRLNDFILDRYAGSMSPSSYASEVTLVDKRKNLEVKHRIYMNHVLDYGGYRFFQSSYDLDEQGTILSVNHDFWGTWVSYSGYILMALGFLLTLLSKNSRFGYLGREIRKISLGRKTAAAALVVLFAGISGSVHSQDIHKPVSREHAGKFGRLLVQTYDGRFEPVQTLAMDQLHKISRKDRVKTTEKGEMDEMQFLLDMMLDPGYWRQQKLIYVRDRSVGKVLGISGKQASFDDFITPPAGYKLAGYAETAFRKRPAEQNTFDKEIIKVDERVNVYLSMMNGGMLKLFPLPGSPDHRWITFTDSLAKDTLFRTYLFSLYDASRTGDYTKADELLGTIGKLQRKYTPANLLPSEKMIGREISYNRSKIFTNLRDWYGMLSVVLLVLSFIENLRTRKSRILAGILWIFTGLTGAAFLYHTYGMALRWYLSGHAPWSNGYEALLLIAWGSLLAGFSLLRYSKISFAATGLVAFMVLMTAGHSSYDPQLTNLQPVLKSYWLIIHVAVITISYGFLALGFILGLINLFLFLFRTRSNAVRVGDIIRELTFTGEMAITVGVVLATIGTFLGGVWANESWGRYWGWDAKETWALVIVITYAFILHMRLVPKLKGELVFSAASVIGFGSVIMTFVGVNYYLSKGLHSYAADEKTVFPLWGWGIILSLFVLILAAGVRERLFAKEK